MSFRGTSRRYDSPAIEYGDALRRASQGGVARIDTSYMEEQNRIKERKESRGAELAMTPGVRKGRVPSWEEPTGFDSDPSLQPNYFEEDGETYTFDPRAKIAYENAGRRRQLQDTAQVETQSNTAADEARVQRLVAAGYSQRDAARQVFGRGGLSMDEQRELIEARGLEQRQRDEQLQESIRSRQAEAQRERGRLAQLLEASRAGDRAADRELRAQIGLVATYDRELDDIDRERRGNALTKDPLMSRLMDDDTLGQARQHLTDLDAREEAARVAREAARGGVKQAPAKGSEQPAPGPTAAAPAAAESVDAKIERMKAERAAARAGGGGGGAPAAAPPAAGGAPAPTAKKPIDPKRVLELKKQGLSREQALKVLRNEGYDVDQE